MQSLILQAMQFNIGGLPSPAMLDNEMSAFLDLDLDQFSPIYTLTMGLIPEMVN